MAWQLSRQGDQYRIWSTISDQYITDWISRSEALAVWYDSALMDFKKKVITEYLKFPNHYSDRDTHRYIVEEERHKQLSLWLNKLADVRDEDEYYRLVDETYEKIRIELEGK